MVQDNFWPGLTSWMYLSNFIEEKNVEGGKYLIIYGTRLLTQTMGSSLWT
jgi:hypothetical protein